VSRSGGLEAKPQPGLHLLGEICGGSGFGAGVGVACKWALEAGGRWELLEGRVVCSRGTAARSLCR